MTSDVGPPARRQGGAADFDPHDDQFFHTPMSDLAIDVQHVVKRYAEHVAVKDLTLAVPKGTVYGLLGPNGAGKTTTIRMILNIIAHGARHIALGLNGEAHSSVATVLSDTTLVTHVDDQNQFFELELAPGASPQRLLERLVTAGAPITRFELVQPSLHQIFLQTVGAEGVEEGMSGQG